MEKLTCPIYPLMNLGGMQSSAMDLAMKLASRVGAAGASITSSLKLAIILSYPAIMICKLF